jgi:hypothetical protein
MMGRLLIFVGIILMVVGFIAPMFSIGNLFSGLQPTLDLATDPQVQEAELCEEGETLEQENGASTYAPGRGYGSSVTLYCVNDAGTRREVTGDFAESLLQDVPGLSNIGGMIGQTFLFSGLGVFGVILTIIGAMMSFGNRRKILMTSYTLNPTGMNIASSGLGNPSPSNPNSPQGLTNQLQQLEQAYQQNLITREEYDKARAKLLGY